MNPTSVDQRILFMAGEIAKGRTPEQLRKRVIEIQERMAALEKELPLTAIALDIVEGREPDVYWMQSPVFNLEPQW